MGTLATIYTLATLAMFLVCALARYATEDADRIARAAAWVALLTGMSRIIGVFLDPPNSLIHYPAQDVFMMGLCLAWWQVRGERWAMLLAGCFFAQLFLHAAFWWGGDVSLLRGYIIANNAVFIAELSILTIAGGSHVVRWVGSRLPVFRGRDGRYLALEEAS